MAGRVGGSSKGRAREMVEIDIGGLSGLEHVVFHEPHADIINDPRLACVAVLVEATTDERLALRARHSAAVEWKPDPSGWMACMGTFAGQPVNATLDFAEIGGKLVCFYSAVSMVVHHGMVDRWLKAHVQAPHAQRRDAATFDPLRDCVPAAAA